MGETQPILGGKGVSTQPPLTDGAEPRPSRCGVSQRTWNLLSALLYPNPAWLEVSKVLIPEGGFGQCNFALVVGGDDGHVDSIGIGLDIF